MFTETTRWDRNVPELCQSNNDKIYRDLAGLSESNGNHDPRSRGRSIKDTIKHYRVKLNDEYMKGSEQHDN